MSSKLSENEHGLTYTLEAILGAILIISTVLFFSNSLPYVAQKTGEHSKVQLMNIGRDNLDLIEVTPVVDINPGYWAGLGIIYRNYTLVADKKFVMPGENVTFTVYTLGYTEILYHNLSLKRSVLGFGPKSETDIGIINGTMVTNFSSVGDFNVRAIDDDESTWSNYVTIKVGHYFLDTDISGIYSGGDLNVSGVVYDSTGSGIPELSIEILDSSKDVISESIPPVNYTSYGRVIDDCEYFELWTSSGTLWWNSTNISKNHSISVYSDSSDSDFWLEKNISTTYNFDKNDILSFYFFFNKWE